MVNFNIHGSTQQAHVSFVEASAALPSVPGLEDSKPLPVTAGNIRIQEISGIDLSS